jgi:hypothetical protein
VGELFALLAAKRGEGAGQDIEECLLPFPQQGFALRRQAMDGGPTAPLSSFHESTRFQARRKGPERLV